MQKISLNVPREGILIAPPDDFAPESQKTSEWFTQYARWIVASFYNQPRNPFYPVNVVQNGFAQEAIENWSYVFGSQENFAYKYMTTDYSGNELPVKWVAGNKIGSLIDYMKGVLLTSVENMEVHVENLSRDVQSEKADMYEKLMIQYQINKAFKDMMPEGVEFQPVNDPEADFSSEENIDKYVEKWQDKYSIMAERIAQMQIEDDQLVEKFVQDGTNQIVSGLSAMLTQVEAGKVTNQVIPDYEIIWDNRVNDPFNGGAMLCGFVKHNQPYQDVIRMFGEQMDKDDVDEIRRMAQSGYSNIDEFVSYYNNNLGISNRFNWWNYAGTSKMTLTYATVYFIAPRDWRYRNGKNLYGSERTAKINPNEEYNVGGGKVKGVELMGDWSGWDIYTATLIGNKYITNFGYANNVLRDTDNKAKPILPMHILCAGMTLNQGKSIVRKLIPLQDELDAYAYKIKEKIANDYGKNYVFNGNKFDGATSTDIANELKTIHVTVATGGSGEPDDPQNAQRMVEVVDMTLDSNIIRYLELRREIMSEMEMYASVSRIALGQQGAVVGKGVQENTIAQNSYGTLSLNWHILRHFKKIIQYNVNLKQLLYQFSDSLDEALTIGDEASYLLRVLDPKQFGTQKFKAYVDIQSALDEQVRGELRTIALSEAQNGKLDTVDFIEHVLMSRTMNQAVKGLKQARNKTHKEMMAQQQSATQAEMQHQADMAHQAAINQAALQQNKEDNANWRAELAAVAKNLDLLMQKLSEGPPVVSPLTVELGAMNQPQPEQQMPPQEQMPQQ
jgi:hypothetical protein